MNYRDAVAKAEEINKALRADDPRFNGTIVIKHREGLLIQESAFCYAEDNFLYCFGEHMPPTVFVLDEMGRGWWFSGEPQEAEDYLPKEEPECYGCRVGSGVHTCDPEAEYEEEQKEEDRDLLVTALEEATKNLSLDDARKLTKKLMEQIHSNNYASEKPGCPRCGGSLPNNPCRCAWG